MKNDGMMRRVAVGAVTAALSMGSMLMVGCGQQAPAPTQETAQSQDQQATPKADNTTQANQAVDVDQLVKDIQAANETFNGRMTGTVQLGMSGIPTTDANDSSTTSDTTGSSVEINANYEFMCANDIAHGTMSSSVKTGADELPTKSEMYIETDPATKNTKTYVSNEEGVWLMTETAANDSMLGTNESITKALTAQGTTAEKTADGYRLTLDTQATQALMGAMPSSTTENVTVADGVEMSCEIDVDQSMRLTSIVIKSAAPATQADDISMDVSMTITFDQYGTVNAADVAVPDDVRAKATSVGDQANATADANAKGDSSATTMEQPPTRPSDEANGTPPTAEPMPQPAQPAQPAPMSE